MVYYRYKIGVKLSKFMLYGVAKINQDDDFNVFFDLFMLRPVQSSQIAIIRAIFLFIFMASATLLTAKAILAVRMFVLYF